MCNLDVNRLFSAERHGAYNVRIFGSATRGTAGPESDLDFLVDVGPTHSAWFPAGLILDLEALEREVDVVTTDALHGYIHNRVLAETVPLLETTAFTWFKSSNASSRIRDAWKDRCTRTRKDSPDNGF